MFDWLSHLVVDVAIGEHGVEVLNAFTSTAVEIILQTLFDGPHVHGLLDDFMVILKRKNRHFFKGWRINVFPRSEAPTITGSLLVG